MANYTYEIATDIIFPNITVYRIYKDGVINGYRVNANDGYVLLDTSEEYNTIIDEETGEYIDPPQYFRVVICSLRTNFDNFSWVAVEENSVPEDSIFGGGDNDHEVM